MSDLTLRETKGSPLTHQELDKNITHVNPVGTVITFAGATPPPYYLECDGQEISRTEYSNLFNVLGELYGAGDGVNTFNLPDLRGEFIRGWDNGKGVDIGRQVGSAQLDQFQIHRHSSSNSSHSVYRIHSGGNRAGIGGGSHDSFGQISITVNDPNSGRTGTETRPRNIAMMYCIKY